jgi:hypothetical protein
MGFIICISTDSWYHSTFFHFLTSFPLSTIILPERHLPLPPNTHLTTTHHLASRPDCIRLALEVVRLETAGLDVAWMAEAVSLVGSARSADSAILAALPIGSSLTLGHSLDLPVVAIISYVRVR